jgi:hypothetical protein
VVWLAEGGGRIGQEPDRWVRVLAEPSGDSAHMRRQGAKAST